MEITWTPEVQEILSYPTCTVDDVAVVLHIGRRQAYEAIHRGEIPSLRIGTRILVPTKRLLAMLGGEEVVPKTA